jgi:hypothetical protein
MAFERDGKTYVADFKTTANRPAIFWVRETRGDTVFLFEPVSDRPADRAIIVYDTSGTQPCYDRIDAVTRKAC